MCETCSNTGVVLALDENGQFEPSSCPDCYLGDARARLFCLHLAQHRHRRSCFTCLVREPCEHWMTLEVLVLRMERVLGIEVGVPT